MIAGIDQDWICVSAPLAGSSSNTSISRPRDE
jgi:hypothetical protein